MKKTAIILAAILSLAACNKIEDNVPIADHNTLYAQIEQETATKTYMDVNNNIRWSEGDQIVGFMNSSLGLKYQILPSSVGKTYASFENISDSNGNINAGTEWDHNVVYYPYSDVVEAQKLGSNYSLSVSLPAEQTYAEDSFGNGSMAMVAVSEDNNITFKNILGGMKLQLKGTQTVMSIKIEGKNNEKLSGAAVVTAYTNNLAPAITITATDEASESVTLNCGSGVQLNESSATEFIIALPPVLFSNGFTVTVTDSESQTYTVETDKANTVLRSSLLVMPAVTLTASGGGDPEEDDDATYIDYVDEHGVNHGKGIAVAGVIWAPVNCGYEPATADYKGYPYGKLYQWGRKYGQGYSTRYDATYGKLVKGPVMPSWGSSETYKDAFFYGSGVWCNQQIDDLWVDGEGKKTKEDPCPTGWRVPTYDELRALSKNYSWSTKDNQSGSYFVGEYTYIEGLPQVFFPAAGLNHFTGDVYDRGSIGGYWSSRPYGSTAAYCLWFNDGDAGMGYIARAIGYSVRCVQE